MKIVLLHLGRKGSGPIFSIEMAKALSSMGHQVVSLVSLFAENKIRWDLSGLRVYFIKTYQTKLQYLLSHLNFIRFYNVIKTIKRENPDVVYCPMGHTWDFILMPFLGRYIRIKTIHDVELHHGENSLFRRMFSYFDYKSAEGFVLLSSKYVPALIEMKVPRERIVVIPHAGFDYYTKDGDNCETKDVILFFGRIVKYKGLDILLEAMKYVIEKYPVVKLRIVGDGDLTEYKGLINGLGDNVELINRWIQDDEVASYVSDVLVVVLPYTHASQSGVIPLAYSFSKPVISTNVGCLDEQIIDGQTGYIIESNNINALSEKILSLLNCPDNAIQMGEKACKFAKTELTWKSSAEKLVRFIHQVQEC